MTTVPDSVSRPIAAACIVALAGAPAGAQSTSGTYSVKQLAPAAALAAARAACVMTMLGLHAQVASRNDPAHAQTTLPGRHLRAIAEYVSRRHDA